jgi:hypothetical protein
MADFWTSTRARSLLETGSWQSNPDGPAPAHEQLCARIARCELPDEYVCFREYLFLMVELLQAWWEQLGTLRSEEWLKEVAEKCCPNLRAFKCWKLLRSVVVSGRIDAVTTLERVRHRGVAFKLESGGRGLIKSRDCGLGQLVCLAQAVELFLYARNKAKSTSSAQRGGRLRISLTVKGCRLFVHRSGDSPRGGLNGKKMQLVMVLASPDFKKAREGRTSADELLFKQLWPNEMYVAEESKSPPSRMRTLVKEVNRALEEALGRAASKAWVVRQDHEYQLSPSAIWKVLNI